MILSAEPHDYPRTAYTQIKFDISENTLKQSDSIGLFTIRILVSYFYGIITFGIIDFG